MLGHGHKGPLAFEVHRRGRDGIECAPYYALDSRCILPHDDCIRTIGEGSRKIRMDQDVRQGAIHLRLP
jgi:hypothetical protein